MPVCGSVGVKPALVCAGRWVPVEKVGPDDTEATIGGLVEGKQYQFRVKALNDEGESEPLETDHATLAKNPYGTLKLASILHLLCSLLIGNIIELQ